MNSSDKKYEIMLEFVENMMREFQHSIKEVAPEIAFNSTPDSLIQVCFVAGFGTAGTILNMMDEANVHVRVIAENINATSTQLAKKLGKKKEAPTQ